jgi:preprotein translocase SecE subunit
MSAENTVEEKRSRRRRRRQEAAEEQQAAEEEGQDRSITAGKGRATPGRRAMATTEAGGNFITRPVRGMRDYLEGVSAEMQKVAWPSREDTRRLTILVIATTVIASIVLGLISLAFTELFRLGLNNPLIFVIFFVAVGVLAFLIYGRNRGGDTSPY